MKHSTKKLIARVIAGAIASIMVLSAAATAFAAPIETSPAPTTLQIDSKEKIKNIKIRDLKSKEITLVNVDRYSGQDLTVYPGGEVYIEFEKADCLGVGIPASSKMVITYNKFDGTGPKLAGYGPGTVFKIPENASGKGTIYITHNIGGIGTKDLRYEFYMTEFNGWCQDITDIIEGSF